MYNVFSFCDAESFLFFCDALHDGWSDSVRIMQPQFVALKVLPLCKEVCFWWFFSENDSWSGSVRIMQPQFIALKVLPLCKEVPFRWFFLEKQRGFPWLQSRLSTQRLHVLAAVAFAG
jgi:hypothetical protein